MHNSSLYVDGHAARGSSQTLELLWGCGGLRYVLLFGCKLKPRQAPTMIDTRLLGMANYPQILFNMYNTNRGTVSVPRPSHFRNQN
jgi:hypothetical protein